MIEFPKRRLKLFSIKVDELLWFLLTNDGSQVFRVTNIPQDAKVVGFNVDPQGRELLMTLESETFPVLREGNTLCKYQVIIQAGVLAGVDLAQLHECAADLKGWAGVLDGIRRHAEPGGRPQAGVCHSPDGCVQPGIPTPNHPCASGCISRHAKSPQGQPEPGPGSAEQALASAYATCEAEVVRAGGADPMEPRPMGCKPQVAQGCCPPGQGDSQAEAAIREQASADRFRARVAALRGRVASMRTLYHEAELDLQHFLAKHPR